MHCVNGKRIFKRYGAAAHDTWCISRNEKCQQTKPKIRYLKIPYLIHHANPYQTKYEEDLLGKRYEIIGHYRMS